MLRKETCVHSSLDEALGCPVCNSPKDKGLVFNCEPIRTPEMEIAKNNMRKYHKEVKSGVFVDVYDILNAFEISNPATAHAIKKLLAPGKRGYKDIMQDLEEAIVSINRAIEIERENNECKTSK